MDTRHLIDAVVQQTTLLIAQLATHAGIRAPMAHIADQVFLESFQGRTEQLDRVLDALSADGRIVRATEGGEERFSTSRVLIPAGSEAGWETAVLDHFRAVCVAIATKLAGRDAAPAKRGRVGGATLAFEVHPAHPHEAEVIALLARVREQVSELWNRVSVHNQEHPVAEHERTRVIFYFGQNVIDPGGEEQVMP